MIKYLSLIILGSLLLSSFVYADDERARLIIKKPVFKDIDNSQFYSKQTLKLTQKMIWEHGGYHPVFSETNREKILNLDMLISKDKVGYSIKFGILDAKKRMIKKSWARGVPKRFLLLQIRLSFYELLYGKLETKKLISKNKKKDKNKLKKKARVDTKEEGKVTTKDLKEENGTSKVMLEIMNRLGDKKTFGAISSLETNVDADEDDLNALLLLKKKSKYSEKRAKEYESNLVRIRKKINLALSHKVKKEKKQKDKDKSEEHYDERKIKPIRNDGSEKQFSIKKTDIRERNNRLLFEYLYLNKSSESHNLITTENNYNFTGARITYRWNLSKEYGDDFILSGLYLLSIGSTAEEFEVPDLINIYLQYLYDPSFLPLDFLLGVHYENQVFINLEELNQGLKQGENRLVWMQYGVEKIFTLFNKKIITSLSSMNLIQSETTYKIENRKKLIGRKLYGEVVYIHSKKLRAGFAAFSENVSNGAEYKLDQNSFLLTFKYTTN